MTIDTGRKSKFKVDFAQKPRRLNAQFFWPDVKPWPRGVIQNCSEGVMYDTYYIFINFNTFSIHPGCLVLSDNLDNPWMVIYPYQMEDYLIKEIEE